MKSASNPFTKPKIRGIIRNYKYGFQSDGGDGFQDRSYVVEIFVGGKIVCKKSFIFKWRAKWWLKGTVLNYKNYGVAIYSYEVEA